nr:DUF2304 domain-containing protein [Eubacterium sp.]
METGQILRMMMVAASVILLLLTTLSLAKRRLKEQFALLWGVISVLVFLGGIFLRPDTWNEYISNTGTLIIIGGIACVVWCLFFLSTQLSVLSRKNQELAMQVSLLNQENERIMDELKKTQKMNQKVLAEVAAHEENTICH